MSNSICGANCEECFMASGCPGCRETNGCPFGVSCMVAEMTRQGTLAAFQEKLIAAFNGLGVADMPEVTELCALRGAFVNLEYTLPGGQKTKFWDDNQILLGYQLHHPGTERCYGLAADAHHLLVCEYGENGAEPELIAFQKL